MRHIITSVILGLLFSNLNADTDTTNTINRKILELQKQAEDAENHKYTRAEVENLPRVLAKTGGFLDVPAEGTALAVLDSRAKSHGACDQFATVFSKLSSMNVVVETNASLSAERHFEFAMKKRDELNAAYVIAVIEGNNEAGVSIYPEDRVAIINASRYHDGQDMMRREERIVKELWRSLGFVTGIGYAPFKNDVFQPVYSVGELDALEWQVMQPMNFQKMYAGMAKRGIKRARHIPYRLAVIEGWAAAPTNQYQKAVWDEVHKLPTEPIKIKPETKKVQD